MLLTIFLLTLKIEIAFHVWDQILSAHRILDLAAIFV